MNRRSLGRAYVAVTSTLLIAIAATWWCFQSYQADALTNVHVQKACVLIWALSGIFLALSQIVFLVIAVRLKQTDETNPRTPAVTRNQVDLLKVVIPVLAVGILLVIIFLVIALSNMPS